jgi:hypothetical protein
MLNTDQFLAPDWLVGTAADVERATNTRAREWAATWQADRSFPAVNLVATGPFAPLLYSTSDSEPEQPVARLFANVNFVPQILKNLGYRDIPTTIAEYEAHVGETPWGSFDALLFQRSPNGLESTRTRLERIVPQLPLLLSTKVVDYDNMQKTAAAVIENQISPTLENWGAPGNEPLATRIRAALAEMKRATPDSIQRRIVDSMLRLIPVASRLRHKGKFTADYLSAALAALDPREREELTGCTRKALLTVLYAIDRETS